MVMTGWLHHINQRRLLPFLWSGVGAGLVVCYAPRWISHTTGGLFPEAAQGAVDGTLSLVTVVLSAWFLVWLADEGGHRIGVRRAAWMRPVSAVIRSPLMLAVCGVFAVISELSSNRYVTGALDASDPLVAVCVLVGVVSGIVLLFLCYLALRDTPTHFFLFISGMFLIFSTAGLLDRGISDLQHAGIIPGAATIVHGPLGQSSHTALGVVFSGLLHFDPNPTLLSLVAWFAYVFSMASFYLFPYIYVGFARSTAYFYLGKDDPDVRAELANGPERPF